MVINISAAVSTKSGSSDYSKFSTGIGIHGSINATSSPKYGITASAAAETGDANTTEIKYQNAQISAGGTLSTISGRDTKLIGANLSGNMVDMYVGRDLLLASLKDYSKSQSKSSSVGGSVSASISANLDVNMSGAGIKGEFKKSNSESDMVSKQSSIIGKNSVNIYTEGNTHLKGAIIAVLNDNLVLNTGTLSFEDVRGSKTNTSMQFGVESKWVPESKQKEEKPSYDRPRWMQSIMDTKKITQESWNKAKQAATIKFSYSDSGTEQTAKATIGGGTIIVRDNPNADLSGLNRDKNNTISQTELPKTEFNMESIYNYMEQAFGAVDNLDKAMEFKQDPNKYIKDKWTDFTKKIDEVFKKNHKNKVQSNPKE